MSEDNKEKMKIKVLDTANRLIAMQIKLAGESDQKRTGLISKEIEQALDAVLPAERKEFFRGLLENIHISNFIPQSISKEQEIQNISDFESKLSSVNILVRSLCEIALKFSDDPPQSIDANLQQDKSESKPQQNYPVESDQKPKYPLQTRGLDRVNTVQLMKLNELLIDFILKLEPLVWNTWRVLSPRSNIRQEGSLNKKIEQFLTRSTEIPDNQIGNDLKVLQRLVASLTSSISSAGSQFAKHHIARFSPSEISALVKMEQGSFFVSHDVKCWRKYVELAETLNEDSIDMDIRKAIVDYVESLTKGISQ